MIFPMVSKLEFWTFFNDVFSVRLARSIHFHIKILLMFSTIVILKLLETKGTVHYSKNNDCSTTDNHNVTLNLIEGYIFCAKIQTTVKRETIPLALEHVGPTVRLSERGHNAKA